MKLSKRLFDFLNELPVDFSMTRWRTTALRNKSKAVGGAPKSKHLTGNAVDLTTDTIEDMRTIASLALTEGIEGIEIDLSNNHLHLDNGPRIWRVIKKADGTEEPLEPYLILHSSL